MGEFLHKEANFSDRKNGLYKKISTLEIEDQSEDRGLVIKTETESSQVDKMKSLGAMQLANDNTIIQDSDKHLAIYQGIKAIREDLQKLEKNIEKNEKTQSFKTEKIKNLAKVSEKNARNIEKLEKGFFKHQEKILIFEEVFKELEMKRLSELREQDLLRPSLTERKIVTRRIFKDNKINSVVSSPRISLKEGLEKVKKINLKK